MKAKLLILLLISAPALAQLPQKGDWLVGADVANLSIFSITDAGPRTTVGNVALMGGKFLSERVVLGAAVPVEWQSVPMFQTSRRATTLAYGLVPFARFYLTNTRIRPYLSVGAGYLFTQYRGEREVSHNGVTYNGNAGLAYFLNRNVSLDLVGNFTSQPYQARSSFSVSNDNRLNFHLRFQIFLRK
jgi:Outer membrane protein beta-barrel domain